LQRVAGELEAAAKRRQFGKGGVWQAAQGWPLWRAKLGAAAARSAVNSYATAETANSAKATSKAPAPLRTCGAAERAARFFIVLRSPLYERAAPSLRSVIARAPFAIRTL
jgi:hypothetical protein